MVRLKEYWGLYQIGHNIISIPYGAIKSDEQWNLFFDYMIFQFLMVRLKVIVLVW